MYRLIMNLIDESSRRQMKYVSLMVSLMCIALPIQGQEVAKPVTDIVIKDGVDKYTAADLEHEVEALLRSIQVWNEKGRDTFPQEPGVAQLKQLVEEYELEVYYETIKTVAIESFDGHTVPNVLLISRQEEHIRSYSLAFTFTLEGEFRRVSLSNNEFSMQRMLAQNEGAQERKAAIAEMFLEQYQQAYLQQDVAQLGSLTHDDALIVTGIRGGQYQQADYYRYNKKQYLQHAKQAILLDGNAIRHQFDSVQVFQDPANDQIIGIYAYQTYKSTVYSDQGYIFMTLDLAGSTPKLLYRTWRANPINMDNYGVVAPQYEEVRNPITYYNKPISIMALTSSVSISRGGLSNLKAPQIAYPTMTEESIITQHKKWIVVGASAVAGGVIYGLLHDGSDQPGIPVPPGRPAFN
jgi:hypothetical protein